MPTALATRTLFFSFSTQFENLGDCVINLLLLQEVGQYRDLEVLAHRLPDWLTRPVTDIKSTRIERSRVKFLSRLCAAVALQKKPGILFKPGHLGAKKRIIDQLRLIATSCCMGFLAVGGCSFRRFGASLDRYGVIETAGHGLLGALHSVYGLRDDESLNLARNLKIRSCCYSPDLAFLLPYESGPPNQKVKLVLSFRDREWLHNGTPACQIEAVGQLCEEYSLTPVVVQQVTFDQTISDSLCQDMQCKCVSFAANSESAESIFETYRSSRIVLSNRLHTLLFAWSKGAIPVAIVDAAKDRKIIGIFEQLGLEDLLINAADLAQLHERTRGLLAAEDELRNRLERTFQKEQTKLKALLNREFGNGGQPVAG